MKALVGRVRGWTLWGLPRRAVAYVLLVDLAAAAAIGYGLWSTSLRGYDVLTFGVLVACGCVSVEASRRIGTPSNRTNRSYKDLLSAWTLPIALLLPPVYAALAPIPLYLLTQVRVTRLPPVKRTFNTAAVGLEGFGAAMVYGLVAGHPDGLSRIGSPVGDPRTLAAMVAAAAVGVVFNDVLVAGVIRLVTPGTSLFRLVLDRDDLATDGGERGMGIVVAVCWTVQPLLVLAAVPPILLLQRALLHAELQEAARTDGKTRLANPAYWREVADRAVTRAAAGKLPLAVLIIDIDHFKVVNDTHGHLVGDEVLAAVAMALSGGVRPRDLVGRFGGEEFVVLLPGADLRLAQRTGERLRQRVESLPLHVGPGMPPVRVTVSIGVAALATTSPDLSTLLETADTALYAAKADGRNRVRTAGPVVDERSILGDIPAA